MWTIVNDNSIFRGSIYTEEIGGLCPPGVLWRQPCVCMYVRMCVCMYMYVHMYVCVCVCMCVCITMCVLLQRSEEH